jgi:hypothetical protein
MVFCKESVSEDTRKPTKVKSPALFGFATMLSGNEQHAALSGR